MPHISTEIQTGKPRKSDKYIPWYFVAFFAVLFIWDGFFVYTATSTHTGVVEDNTYNRGLNYNETIAAADTQAALDWQSEITFSPKGILSFKLEKNDGTAVRSANVKAQFFRPTQAG
ncbi:MAG: FixH family protein, partial [Kordiimonadaceae bacterium]|nr:FixH family protein [Kordiimonadaceae bacterium]